MTARAGGKGGGAPAAASGRRPAPATPAGRRAPAAKPAGGGRNALILSFLLAPLGLVVLPTTLLLLLGLLPTVAALLVDRDPGRHGAITVGCFNLCGIAPVLIPLWESGHTLDGTLVLLREPLNWLLMYGAAALGWLFFFVVPPAVAVFLAWRMQDRIRELKARQKTLTDEWGPEVARPPPPAPPQRAEKSA